VPSRSTADHSVSPPPSGSRDYNAAYDLIERNLAAGRAAKLAYVDDASQYTFGELSERRTSARVVDVGELGRAARREVALDQIVGGVVVAGNPDGGRLTECRRAAGGTGSPMGELRFPGLQRGGKRCAAILCSARAPARGTRLEQNIVQGTAQGGRPWN